MLKQVTIKNVALSTALDLNKGLLNNLKTVKENIQKDLLSKTPPELHHIINQSFKSSTKDRALNSIKTKKDIMHVLVNNLVWIPPNKIVLDEDGNQSNELSGDEDENEIFYYVPIQETLKELLNDASLKKSSNLGIA